MLLIINLDLGARIEFTQIQVQWVSFANINHECLKANQNTIDMPISWYLHSREIISVKQLPSCAILFDFHFFFLPFGVCWWSHVRTQPAHQLNRHTTQTKAKQNNVYVRYKNRSLMSLFECWSAWSCARERISVLLTDLVYRRVDISTAMFHCRYLSFTLAVAMFSLAVCHFSVQI